MLHVLTFYHHDCHMVVRKFRRIYLESISLCASTQCQYMISGLDVYIFVIAQEHLIIHADSQCPCWESMWWKYVMREKLLPHVAENMSVKLLSISRTSERLTTKLFSVVICCMSQSLCSRKVHFLFFECCFLLHLIGCGIVNLPHRIALLVLLSTIVWLAMKPMCNVYWEGYPQCPSCFNASRADAGNLFLTYKYYECVRKQLSARILLHCFC